VEGGAGQSAVEHAPAEHEVFERVEVSPVVVFVVRVVSPITSQITLDGERKSIWGSMMRSAVRSLVIATEALLSELGRYGCAGSESLTAC
jgi:hypothetical protein